MERRDTRAKAREPASGTAPVSLPLTLPDTLPSWPQCATTQIELLVKTTVTQTYRSHCHCPASLLKSNFSINEPESLALQVRKLSFQQKS